MDHFDRKYGTVETVADSLGPTRFADSASMEFAVRVPIYTQWFEKKNSSPAGGLIASSGVHGPLSKSLGVSGGRISHVKKSTLPARSKMNLVRIRQCQPRRDYHRIKPCSSDDRHVWGWVSPGAGSREFHQHRWRSPDWNRGFRPHTLVTSRQGPSTICRVINRIWLLRTICLRLCYKCNWTYPWFPEVSVPLLHLPSTPV